VHPLISKDELSIEINEVLDDDFQKVHAVVLELTAELDHVRQIEHVGVNIAEFVRVILLETLDDRPLVVRLLKELGEALQGLVGGSWVDEGLDEEIEDYLVRLLACASVDSENLEEEVVVVGEGCLKPVDSM
jgi:hypothetical protein